MTTPNDERDTSPGDVTPRDGRDGEDGFDLLTSPLRRVRFGRGFVISGPIGLAIALVASLWVSTMHIRHSLLVQVERTWVAGERLGMRVAVVATRSGPIEDTLVQASVEQGGKRHELPDAGVMAGGSIAEVGFDVPALEPGPATLHVRVRAKGVDPIDETIDVEVATSREASTATPVVAGSVLQHGDDSDAQPEALRIVVRPARRLLAGFDNELFIRVTDAAGVPFVGSVEVALVRGELLGRVGNAERPPILHDAPPDALGLVRLVGPLGSEVMRLRIRATPPGGTAVERSLRLVSFAGAVDVVAEPLAVAPGDTLEVKAWSLSTKVPVHVDLHASSGALTDVMFPPIVGLEPPRPWQVPASAEGLLQIEAHNHVTAPGESTAIARVQITEMDPTLTASLRPLVVAQREAVDIVRIEQGYDAALERKYLDWIERASLGPTEVETARRFLLGTLPPAVYGPPLALVTRPRLEEELARKQGAARIGMRIFLLGGGAIFLATMAFGMIRSHSRTAEQTLAELRQDAGDATQLAELEHQIHAAARAGILRGFGVIGIMVGGIALVMFILERIVWVY
jgi:hypothetical protein